MDPFHKKEIYHENLKHWFEREKRIFPWRENPTPYRVWVSEVMLQQTRAAVVIPYFERWIEQFPTIQSLASAPLDTVIKVWEGLGYYSRARNLHEGAKMIVSEYGGEIPSDPKLLEKIKGLGPYTIGAIRSFAFHQKAAAVDGNVLRVITRLYNHEEEIDLPSTQKLVREKVEELLPDTKPWVIMEALIELGATLCLRRPLCEQCPMQNECMGYLLGKAENLPKRKKRSKIILLRREVFVICHQKKFLIQKQEGKKVMAGLYEFPYAENDAPPHSIYPGELHKRKKLRHVVHSFTRYKAHLYPTLWEAEEKKEVPGFIWAYLEEMDAVPFSSGHRKIYHNLKEDYADFTH